MSWASHASLLEIRIEPCSHVAYKLHLGVDWQPPILIELYLKGSRCPFEEWLDGLRDRAGRAKVRVQIDRIMLGNFGKCRFLKGGIGELRVAWGPGLRIYFAALSPRAADIVRASDYWSDFQEQRHGKQA